MSAKKKKHADLDVLFRESVHDFCNFFPLIHPDINQTVETLFPDGIFSIWILGSDALM